MRSFSLLVLVGLAIANIGCSQVEELPAPAEKRSAMVVSAAPGFELANGDALCVHPLIGESLRDPRLANLAALEQVEPVILDQLQGMQLQVVDGDATCQYWMVYTVVTSQQLSDSQLIALFDISPGLNEQAANVDGRLATLMFSVVAPDSGRVLFSSSLQGLANTAQDQHGREYLDMDDERLAQAVTALLRHLPMQG
ncbi:hypothetical protein [Aliagarivorans marinus]|uniref:hypothetical protein n=1 Tax=Aliagarivorans marinus TaxID=561965 RepID=UPI0004221DE9|nr:hypothetical protein [Aliagarivorans marinus]